MLNKKHLTIGLFFVLMFTLVSCSDKDGLSNATHIVNVYPVGIGLQRMNDTEIFLSEEPFENYDRFRSLGSVPVPENRTIEDFVKVDVSDYVGKTIYFVALRKHLFSDRYHNITIDNENQSLSSIRVAIQQETPTYDLTFMVEEPDSYDRYDIAELKLTVKKGSAVVPNRAVYHYGESYTWSDAMKQNIENHYRINGEVRQTLIGSTDTNGILTIIVPVNERGVVGSGAGTIDYNEHILFVIDDGRVQPITVKVTSLELDDETLQY